VLFPSTTPFGVACGLRSFETALNSLIGKLTPDCIGDNTVFVRGIYPNRKGVLGAEKKERPQGVPLRLSRLEEGWKETL
jgi:hypothetical protein